MESLEDCPRTLVIIDGISGLLWINNHWRNFGNNPCNILWRKPWKNFVSGRISSRNHWRFIRERAKEITYKILERFSKGCPGETSWESSWSMSEVFSRDSFRISYRSASRDYSRKSSIRSFRSSSQILLIVFPDIAWEFSCEAWKKSMKSERNSWSNVRKI